MLCNDDDDAGFACARACLCDEPAIASFPSLEQVEPWSAGEGAQPSELHAPAGWIAVTLSLLLSIKDGHLVWAEEVNPTHWPVLTLILSLSLSFSHSLTLTPTHTHLSLTIPQV
jgi:hypothetical protein